MNEKEIISEFNTYYDWVDKYNYIIEIGNNLPAMNEEHKVNSNIVKGCQSKVWINAQCNNGRVIYEGDSDTIIVKGIVGLIIEVLSGETPDYIINTKLDFIEEIGLKEHLSPSRVNGMFSIIRQMKMYAIKFKQELSNSN